jgi:FkbM family methyltransferase
LSKIIHFITFLVRIFIGNKSIIKVNFKDEKGLNLVALAPFDSIATALKDVIILEEYDRLGIPAQRNLIVDVGSHVGFYALKHASSTKKIICLEPNPINYKLLCLNIALNKLKNVLPLKVALWRERGEVLMEAEQNSVSHHIINTEEGFYSHSHYKVESITLRDLIDMFGDIDVLKLDIEGAENIVIPSFDQKSLDKVAFLVAELHSLSYIEEHKIRKLLQNAGFQVSIFRPPPHGTSATKIFANIFYLTNLPAAIKILLLFLSLFSRCYPHRIKLMHAQKNVANSIGDLDERRA